MASEEYKPRPEDYDGKVTQEQIDTLEQKRVAFRQAYDQGSADLDALREDYQTYADQILIDLSGKLEPGQETEQTTTDVDKFGIRCIYKSTAANRFFDDFKLEEKMRNYRSGKKSEWSTEYTCDTKEIIQDVEATIYEKINGFKKEADTISLKLNGPAHKNGARFWIIPDFATDGDKKRTMEIEDPHPNNKGINPKPLTEIGDSIIGKWIGYKGISIVSGDKRHVESWIHFPVEDIDNVSKEQDKWRQYINYDVKEEKYLKATGSLITSRLDGVKKGDPPDFRYASVREVQE
jgi:hypothetical protein